MFTIVPRPIFSDSTLSGEMHTVVAINRPPEGSIGDHLREQVNGNKPEGGFDNTHTIFEDNWVSDGTRLAHKLRFPAPPMRLEGQVHQANPSISLQTYHSKVTVLTEIAILRVSFADSKKTISQGLNAITIIPNASWNFRNSIKDLCQFPSFTEGGNTLSLSVNQHTTPWDPVATSAEVSEAESCVWRSSWWSLGKCPVTVDSANGKQDGSAAFVARVHCGPFSPTLGSVNPSNDPIFRYYLTIDRPNTQEDAHPASLVENIRKIICPPGQVDGDQRKHEIEEMGWKRDGDIMYHKLDIEASNLTGRLWKYDSLYRERVDVDSEAGRAVEQEFAIAYITDGEHNVQRLSEKREISVRKDAEWLEDTIAIPVDTLYSSSDFSKDSDGLTKIPMTRTDPSHHCTGDPKDIEGFNSAPRRRRSSWKRVGLCPIWSNLYDQGESEGYAAFVVKMTC